MTGPLRHSLFLLAVTWSVSIELLADTSTGWVNSNQWQNAKFRVGASTAFEYRFGVMYQAPQRDNFPSWYLGGHVDTAVLSEGFNPLNVGMELGFHIPAAPWLSMGLHMEQPFYTDNPLVGISSTLHSPLVGDRVRGFFQLQLLRYREPTESLNDYPRQRFFNTLVGVSVQLGKTP